MHFNSFKIGDDNYVYYLVHPYNLLLLEINGLFAADSKTCNLKDDCEREF
jgi:L-rhamnose isomerase